MYNLIVSAQDDAWKGEPFYIELSRAVREYTDEAISKKFGALDAESCAAVQSLPTLFAEEAQNKKPAPAIVAGRKARRFETESRMELDGKPQDFDPKASSMQRDVFLVVPADDGFWEVGYSANAAYYKRDIRRFEHLLKTLKLGAK